MKKHILVIDDDPDIVMAIRTILEIEGYVTEKAFNGHEGIANAQRKHPQLILLDYMLPDMTGGQVVQKLRSKESTRDIPIVLVSAAHDLSNLVKDLPIQGLIEKPFELEVLTSTVAELVV